MPDQTEANSIAPPDDNPKEVAFYGAAVQAWIDSKMEYDRTLIMLSAGALALLVTILTTVGVSAAYQVGLYVIACVCFAVCIGVCLRVYRRNSDYILEVLTKSKPSISMLRLDRWALVCFFSGVAAFAAIGVTTAVSRRPSNVSQACVQADSATAEQAAASARREESAGFGSDQARQSAGARERAPQCPESTAATKGAATGAAIHPR